MAQPVKLFFCYAQADEIALEHLKKALMPLERSNLLQTWHRRQILPGMPVAQEIEARLDQAQIAIVLLSTDFLSSDYCDGIEMAHVLQRHREGKIHVVPVLLQPCFWKDTPLKDLQPLPHNGKPISTLSKQQPAWHEVAMSIQTLAKHFQEQATEQEPAEPTPNGAKARGKARPSTPAKRKPLADAAIKTRGPRTTRATRVISGPGTEQTPHIIPLPTPEREQAAADEPEPTTAEAETTAPDYDQRYGHLQEKIKQIRLKILVWDPALPTEGIVADERRTIHHSLQAEQHESWLGRDLKVPPGFSLQDREVEQAAEADLTILLAEQQELGEMNEFCQQEELLSNTLIFFPENRKSPPENWGLDRRLSLAYRNLEYYQEKDILSCIVRTIVLDCVKARRSVRYSSQSRRGR